MFLVSYFAFSAVDSIRSRYRSKHQSGYHRTDPKGYMALLEEDDVCTIKHVFDMAQV